MSNSADQSDSDRPRFSICTMVTNWPEYGEMRKSFEEKGFVAPRVEYLIVDNSNGNQKDGYQSFNWFLRRAQGRYVIVCHQDIQLLDHGVERLDEVIGELDEKDPTWAVLGNAGGQALARWAFCISDPYGGKRRTPGLPRRVISLDENFILLRSEANLACSRNLSGFHLYGTDVCLVADLLGWTSYVVDFHLLHKGAGSSKGFAESRARLINKYRVFMRPRWIQTTCTEFVLGASRPVTELSNAYATRMALHWGARIVKRLVP